MKNLLLCPSVGYWKDKNKYFLDKKFHDGVIKYLGLWPGSITLLMRESSAAFPQYGAVEIDPDSYPAKLREIGPYEKITETHLQGAHLVLAAADDYRTLHLSHLCRLIHVKCIYVIEYILETRVQIIALERCGILQKLKSYVWLISKEYSRRKAFKLADGLQANGTPAMDTYSSLTPDSLLFFDTRNTIEMSILDADLETRLSSLDKGKPLRLAFSGRLVAMKGADHLLAVATKLRDMAVSFSMDIFGAGELTDEMQEAIRQQGLGDLVNMHGPVDFEAELVPYMKENVDLFVCCHRQSDPSCTYLETYACGVPIVGYDNRAHQGILDRQDVGWSVKMNDIDALAKLIARLVSEPDEIKLKSRRAAQFARQHTFEETFHNRIEHCIRVANR